MIVFLTSHILQTTNSNFLILVLLCKCSYLCGREYGSKRYFNCSFINRRKSSIALKSPLFNFQANFRIHKCTRLKRVCVICQTSLPIHIPQCQQKWLQQEEQKPKNERRKLPKPPVDMPTDGTAPRTTEEVDDFNKKMSEHFENVSLDRCDFCGRTFK